MSVGAAVPTTTGRYSKNRGRDDRSHQYTLLQPGLPLFTRQCKAGPINPTFNLQTLNLTLVTQHHNPNL